MIHHTFIDGEYQRFDRMQEHVTVAQVSLSDHRTAPAEIDRILLQCLLHSRPVRITIPVDMAIRAFLYVRYGMQQTFAISVLPIR